MIDKKAVRKNLRLLMANGSLRRQVEAVGLNPGDPGEFKRALVEMLGYSKCPDGALRRSGDVMDTVRVFLGSGA